MKNILIIISLIVASFLCSCENNAVSKGRKAYKEYFNKILKDPNSLVIYNEEILKSDNSSATFILDVGAKNSYGGMVRQSYTIKTVGNSILDVTEYDIRKLPKQESKKKNEIKFTYKAKTLPIVFSPDDHVGKEYVLSDSCVYSCISQDLENKINAAKNRNFEKVEYLGGILPSGTKVKIISSDERWFEVKSEHHTSIYIEQSAIFGF